MQDIEVEVRGSLDQEGYKRLDTFFSVNGVFQKTKNRLLIDYSTFLPNEGVRERTRDIRLRMTNGKPEIVVKIGAWGGTEQRRELSVLTEEGSFDTLVEIFGVLGFRKGAMCVRNSRVYDYRGVEFALVEVPGHSYYFEAEKMVSQDEDREVATMEIRSLCQELGLELFTQEAFFSYIERLNKESNKIFDIAEYHEGDFKRRFASGAVGQEM